MVVRASVRRVLAWSDLCLTLGMTRSPRSHHFFLTWSFAVAALAASACNSDTPAAPSNAPSTFASQTTPAPSPTPNPSPSPTPTPTTYVYSGQVTDSQGRPVAGALVEGGPNFGATDANGHYESQSPYDSVPGRVRPPDGYEPKPVRSTDNGFVLNPGGQDITIRRITSVNLSPPSTLKVGVHVTVNALISFDSGQTASPVDDLLIMSSSDPAVLKVGSGHGLGPAFVEGLQPGNASVSGRYFGVSSATFQVQVTP